MNAPRDRWLLLQTGPGHYDFNMAMDEALLEAVSALSRPVLRFYGWVEKAASFGYFQRVSDVEQMTGLRPLVRRPTAGGLVPHATDWTYSLVIPPSHTWYALRAAESYERTHQWIQDAFALLGVATELSPCCQSEGPGQCFVGAERHDLLWHGRKIAGAAQRRTRNGLLIQGSVQPQPQGVAKVDWQKAMCDVAHREWSVEWEPFELETSLRDQAEALARQKYSRDDYNRRR